MSAPLTTRDALAAALCEIRDEDEHAAHIESPCRYCHTLAAELLASGALTDATKLAEDEALVERVKAAIKSQAMDRFTSDYLADDARAWLAGFAARAALDKLAAALSAQSERAEVER